MCGQPQQLLTILQQTLPPQVFHLLLQRLPMIGQVSLHFLDWEQLILTRVCNCFQERVFGWQHEFMIITLFMF